MNPGTKAGYIPLMIAFELVFEQGERLIGFAMGQQGLLSKRAGIESNEILAVTWSGREGLGPGSVDGCINCTAWFHSSSRLCQRESWATSECGLVNVVAFRFRLRYVARSTGLIETRCITKKLSINRFNPETPKGRLWAVGIPILITA